MARIKDLYITARKLCSCTESLMNWMLSDWDLTVAQCYLLVHIYKFHPDGTFTTDLHRELGLSMASVSGSLKRLRQKGYLALAGNQVDERQKKIVPTKRLADIADELEQIIRKSEKMLYGTVSEQEKLTLLHLEEKAMNCIADLSGKAAM